MNLVCLVETHATYFGRALAPTFIRMQQFVERRCSVLGCLPGYDQMASLQYQVHTYWYQPHSAHRMCSGLLSEEWERARAKINYREPGKSMQILLSNNQAGPGRTVKQEQDEISRNHVQAFSGRPVHTCASRHAFSAGLSGS